MAYLPELAKLVQVFGELINQMTSGASSNYQQAYHNGLLSVQGSKVELLIIRKSLSHTKKYFSGKVLVPEAERREICKKLDEAIVALDKVLT